MEGTRRDLRWLKPMNRPDTERLERFQLWLAAAAAAADGMLF